MSSILVLYSELAPYFVTSLRRFVQDTGTAAHVVRWPIHADAPFEFEDEPGITYYPRKEMDIPAMVALGEKIQPKGLYVSGWIDKDYLKVAKHFRKKGLPVIAAIDTQWLGNFRQRLAVLSSPVWILPVFTHCWVPGIYQLEYARRLGFKESKVPTGMYAADTQSFTSGYEARMAQKAVSYPKVFLYVGRMMEMKGVLELYAAFNELCTEAEHGWKLIMVGNGMLLDQVLSNEHVEVMPFLRPEELPGLADRAGAFILPSRYEAWGVVVHEFAAAGLPLILSNTVGASPTFLRQGYNGFLHEAHNKDAIKAAMRRMMALTDAERLEMGHRSNLLSQQISASTWSHTLNEIINPT